MLNIPLSDNTIHEKREGWHAPNLSQVTTILIWFIQGHKDPTEQLQDYDLPKEELSRIIYIVSHHHTYTGVDGQDYQIMLEADFLVNADESKMTDEAISNFKEKVFRTKTGLTFLQELYGKKERA